MKTAAIYTHYALSHVQFGASRAKCWIEKPDFSHNEDIGYELTVTIPSGARLTTNAYGDVLLDTPDEKFYIPLYYSDTANRIEGQYGEPVNGVHILAKIEI